MVKRESRENNVEFSDSVSFHHIFKQLCKIFVFQIYDLKSHFRIIMELARFFNDKGVVVYSQNQICPSGIPEAVFRHIPVSAAGIQDLSLIHI